jgi:asparagine synthase (glutamine-hydrolysing)
MMHTTPESLHEPLPWQHPHLDLTITADARIDNREELFATLALPHDCRAGMPDSQLILYAYEKWGQNCPRHLLGDFAFAIWDGRTRTLFCARDPLGVKPFYYALHGPQFVFASDIRGVLACPGVPRRPNMSFIAAYLYYPTFMYHPAETFHKDVRKLPPAQTLTINAAGARRHVYLDWEEVPPLRLSSDAEYAEMLRDLITQAVQCRMRSAYPVGAHLSGGLDSSIITVLAARHLREMGQQLAAFSWSPPPTDEDRPLGEKDERRLVEAVADQEHISVYYAELTEDDLWRWWTHDIATRPLANTWREPAVRRMAAAQNMRVLLSGWGGDQGALPTGWGYLSELFLQGRWVSLWRELHAWGKGNKRQMWRRFKTMVLTPMLPDYLYWHAFPNLTHLRWPALLKTDVVREMAQVAPLGHRSRHVYGSVRTTQLRELEQRLYGHRAEAWHADGAECRIEYRYPLLDRRIVEFGLAIPSTQSFRNGRGRFVLKQAAEGVVPEQVRSIQVRADPVMMEDDKVVQKPVRQRLIDCMARNGMPQGKLYWLDSTRIHQLQEQFDKTSLWYGFTPAVRCEYMWQYHADSFTYSRSL